MSEQPPLEQAPADYRALLIGARTKSGLTYEEISQATGLRPAYLEALERGTLGSVVSQPHARSMLTWYASHLGLDPDALLRLYEVAVDPSRTPAGDATGRPSGPSTTRRAADRPNGPRRRPQRKWRSLWPALGVALAAVVVAVVLVDPFHLDVVGRMRAVSFAAGTNGGGPALTTTTSTTSPATVATATTTATTTSPASTSTTKPKRHAVRIVPTNDVWLELTSESGATVLFKGMRKAGEELSFNVFGSLRATVGRPEAVMVFLDGEQASLPGATLWLITATEVHERSSG